MRFSLIATSLTAIVASPFVAAASGPQMTSDQFLGAVRCAAYERTAEPEADFSATRFQLNTEARHQSDATLAQARADVDDIARRAAGIENVQDVVMMRRERAAVCAGAAMIANRAEPNGAA